MCSVVYKLNYNEKQWNCRDMMSWNHVNKASLDGLTMTLCAQSDIAYLHIKLIDIDNIQ